MKRITLLLITLALALPPLVFLGLFFLWPVANILALGLAPGDQLQLGHVLQTWAQPWVLDTVVFTLALAGLSTALTLLLGLPAAWVFARFTFPGKAVARALDALAQSEYYGAMPVPLSVYSEQVKRQSIRNIQITRDQQAPGNTRALKDRVVRQVDIGAGGGGRHGRLAASMARPSRAPRSGPAAGSVGQKAKVAA